MKFIKRIIAGCAVVAMLFCMCIVSVQAAEKRNEYDDNNTKIWYDGAWGAFAVPYAGNGTVHSAYAKGSRAVITVTGASYVELYGGRGTDRGFYTVELDGTQQAQGDQYASTTQYNCLLDRINLPDNGEHIITLTDTGEKNASSGGIWMEFDGIVTDGTLINTERKIVDPEEGNQIIDDPMLEYTGQWSAYSMLDENRGFHCNTATSGNVPGLTASYTFAYCEGIRWYSTTGSSYCKADVYIDGEFVKTVDVKHMTAGTPSAVFDSGALQPGRHTFTVKYAEGTDGYLEIDRIIGVGENKEGFSVVNASNRNFIIPIGNTKTENGKLTLERNGSATISFYGTLVRLFGTASGNYTVIMDGKQLKGKPENGMLFCAEGLNDNGHVLRIIPDNGGVMLESCEFSCAQSVAKIMSDAAQQELQLIEAGEKEVQDVSQWQPVAKKAQMPLDGVTLNGGVFGTAFDRNIKYLKYCYNKKSTKYADATGVWTDDLAASTEGRMMAIAGNTLRWREDAQVREILNALIADIKQRTQDNGSAWCMPYPESNYQDHPGSMIDEDRNYDRVMFTRGLTAAVKAGNNDAEVLLRNFYDWFDSCGYLPGMLHGGMGVQGTLGTVFTYESKVGKPEDLYVNMKYYDMDWFIDGLIDRVPETIYRYALNRPHSYLLTEVQALLAQYIATGNERYLNAVLGAWDIFHDYFVTTGGGICICEGPIYYPGNYTLNTKNGVYENCGNVFWVELNARLLELYPTEEKYAQQIEQCIYNMLLASQDGNGKIRYFQHYNGQKYAAGAFNTCCENMAGGQIAMLPQYVYSVADDGVYVNLFAKSSISFEVGGRKLALTMDTDFPNTTAVSLTVQGSGKFTLRLRVPGWNKGDMDILLNGNKIGTGKAGQYYIIQHDFVQGDVISFNLAPATVLHSYTGETQIENKQRCAVTYGPILMACVGAHNLTHKADGENVTTIGLDMTQLQLEAALIKNEDLTFSVMGVKNYKFVPYYLIQNEYFAVFPAVELDAQHDDPTIIPTESAPAPTATASAGTEQTQDKPTVLPIIPVIAGVLVVILGIVAVVAVKRKKK